jgi:3-oxoacyl-[acyl-carrier protein] reductase
MEVKLDGRVALITGGSKGIGLAVAIRMAASGADVAMLARREDALEEARQVVAATAKGRVQVFRCDVSKADEVRVPSKK